MSADVWRVLTDSQEIMDGIANGIYRIWGGVIRHAAGSSQGGQIIAHLKFPDGQQAAQQSIEKLRSVLDQGFSSAQAAMGGLQQSMNALQGLQVANLAMSGLNLAVSVAGFAIICSKLNKLSLQIQAQSADICEILNIVSEDRERSSIVDEANFRSIIASARQFSDEKEYLHLKSLLPAINKEYEFNRLILRTHADVVKSNIERLPVMTAYQERLVHIGLLRSHLQYEMGSLKYAEESLQDLMTELPALNKTRVESLLKNKDTATKIQSKHFPHVLQFLDRGKAIIPALAYESNLLSLERSEPGMLKNLAANDSSQILILPYKKTA